MGPELIVSIAGVTVSVVVAIGGAAGWVSNKNARHIDGRFDEILQHVNGNEQSIELVERDLREMQLRLPKEFVMREEFISRMNDGAKKMDYLVEQVDAIKSMLMYGREKA